MSWSVGSGIVKPDSQPPMPWSQVEPPPPPNPPNPPPSPPPSIPLALALSALVRVESGRGRLAVIWVLSRRVVSGRTPGRGAGVSGRLEASGAVLGPRMVPLSCRLLYIQ